MAKKQARKSEKTLGTCMDCVHATLMQWGNDPIIADCKAFECREVARPQRYCDRFEKEAELPKPIQHFPKYAGLQIKKTKETT